MMDLSHLKNMFLFMLVGTLMGAAAVAIIFIGCFFVIVGGYFIADLINPVDWPDKLNTLSVIQFIAVAAYIGGVLGAVFGCSLSLSGYRPPEKK